MPHHFCFQLSEIKRSQAAIGLALFFLLGLLLGVWFSLCASDALVSPMRAVVSGRVSIIGLLSSLALPLLFSAFAVYIGRPLLLIPIAFCKAFSFSFLGCGLLTAWNSAGWLITCLTLFPTGCSLPVLCRYWLGQIFRPGFRLPPLLLSLAALAVIGIANYYLILPFLAVIITF